MPLTFTLGGLCCDKDAAKFYFNTSRRSLAALAFAGVGEVSPNLARLWDRVVPVAYGFMLKSHVAEIERNASSTRATERLSPRINRFLGLVDHSLRETASSEQLVNHIECGSGFAARRTERFITGIKIERRLVGRCKDRFAQDCQFQCVARR
jgi:hypothetical protein